MGLITNLIKMNQEKKQSDAERHLKANESLLKLAGLPEEQLYSLGFDPAEFRSKIAPTAIDNIVDIYGKNVGKEHKQGGGIIKTMLSGLAGLNPAPRDEFRNQQTPKTPQAQSRTQADVDKFKQQRAAVEADIEAQQVAANEKARKTEDEKARQTEIQNRADGLAKAKSEGLIDDERYKEALARVYAGGSIPEPRIPPRETKAETDNDLAFAAFREKNKLPEGSALTAQQRVQAIKDYKEGTKGETPKAETGELKQNQDALRDLHPEWSDTKVKQEAAKRLLTKKETAEKTAETRLGKALQDRQAAAAPSAENTDAIRSTAMMELITGDKPTYGLGRSADRDAYNKERGRLLTQLGPQKVAAMRASFRAGSAELWALMKQTGMVDTLESAFQLDIQNAREASAAVPRTSVRRFNSWVQFAQADLTDNPELAQFRIATQTAVNQYGRIMVMGGRGSDETRSHAEALLSSAMASGTFDAALDQLNKEAGNMLAGLGGATSRARQGIEQIGGASGPPPAANTPPPAAGGNDTVKRLLDKYK